MSQSIWTHLDELTRETLEPAVDPNSKKGELVMAGTGIASLRQLTVETLDYIQRADKVFYCISDVVTQAFVKHHAKSTVNLYQYYEEEKPRAATYTQMAEVMLNSVREGNLTLGLFYGHPGVFVTPSHRAIYIAKQEGYKAKMLPGISAEDTLYADFGVDPATCGCQMFEATHLLAEPDRLDPRSHALIWQPGCINRGDMRFDNSELYKLADYLEKAFGPEHTIFAYLAAYQPFNDAKIDKILVKDLRDAQKVKELPINATTTIYVPPKNLPKLWDGCEKHLNIELMPTSAYRFNHPDVPCTGTYTDAQKKWVEELENFKPVPFSHYQVVGSPALQRAVMMLALHHHRLNDKLSQAEIAARMVAFEPELTVAEQGYLTDYIGELSRTLLEGQKRAPPSVNGGGDVNVVNLNIIARDPYGKKATLLVH